MNDFTDGAPIHPALIPAGYREHRADEIGRQVASHLLTDLVAVKRFRFDPERRAALETLRRFVEAADEAMAAEGIAERIRDAVVSRILTGQRDGIAQMPLAEGAAGQLTGWSADQSAWPAHLRDDAPKQRCSGCGRQTVASEAFGRPCRMPQPDGRPCAGTFGATS